MKEEDKIRFEKQFGEFPHRVIRRDTTTYYLQSALELAYQQFVAKNPDKVTRIKNEFKENVQYSDFLNSFLKYSLFTHVATDSPFIKPKEQATTLENNEEFKYRQEVCYFLNNLFEALPIDLNLETYKDIIITFDSFGGGPSILNSFLIPSFYHRCKKAGREDILDMIKEVWNLTEDNFGYNEKNGFYEYISLPLPEEFDKVSLDKIIEDIGLITYNSDGNIAKIDSLIAINQIDSIGKYIHNYQFIKYRRGEIRDLIEFSKNIEDLVPADNKPLFYDYWGMAHLSLREFVTASEKFKKAIENKKNLDGYSGAVINYATTLAELGRYDEAIEILETQRDKWKSVLEQFQWWDALGYAYSLFDVAKAKECYDRADMLLKTESPFIGFYSSQVTRHFIREADLYENDLFKVREAIINARSYSGEDAPTILFEGFDKGIYLSGWMKFKILSFDRVGADKALQRAQNIFRNLDESDYRIIMLQEAEKVLGNLYDNYGNDFSKGLELLDSKQLSPLHKLWLLAFISKDFRDQIIPNPDIDLVDMVTNRIKENAAEIFLSLSTSESSEIASAVYHIQHFLLTEQNLKNSADKLADFNLLRKGLSLATKTALEKNLKDKDPEASKIFTRLNQLRKNLNAAYAYEDSIRVKKLIAEISNHEVQFFRSLSSFVSEKDIFAPQVGSIKEKIGSDDLIVDFIQYMDDDKIKIGAFVYGKDSEVSFIEICSLYPESDLKIGSDFWTPLMPYIQGKNNIYFSPDGILQKEGIEFFIDDNGEPMIQNHCLHRVSHLKDIGAKDSPLNEDIVLIGVSDHNNPIGKGETAYRGNWSDLENVKYEISLIENSLKNYPHTILFNDDAIEENIKRLDGQNIALLHFSTHGVYRDTETLEIAASDKENFDYNIAKRILKQDNPRISGIILRRGNISWKMPHLLDDEDDILTAEEIENLNFPGLQLVVLSACDSGLGTINSEGVDGLQRAFKIAGANNIICSLNEVNDQWSAEFMQVLYEKIAEGEKIYDAFRYAQKKIYEAAPDNKKAWASYILIE